MARPHVVLSVATSLDGCIDDTSPHRLVLSGAEDLDRVDEVRAGVDAILVGAATIRADDPRLLVRSEQRRARRVRQGRPPSPLRVTVTASGALDPDVRFFTVGDSDRVVYTTSSSAPGLAGRLADRATVVGAGDPVHLDTVLSDLADRGVTRLMVEGGSRVHTWFLAAGLVDELHLAVAPFLVGEVGAPRFVDPTALGAAGFPPAARRRMTLVETTRAGDVVVLTYRAG